MENKFMVWYMGEMVEIEIGQKVLVAKASAGRSFMGEYATFERTTTRHLVFKTDSGKVVKTAKDNIHEVIGKAKQAGYSVSLNIDNLENNKNFYKINVIL